MTYFLIPYGGWWIIAREGHNRAIYRDRCERTARAVLRDLRRAAK